MWSTLPAPWMILQRESHGVKLERMLHISIMTTATWTLVNLSVMENLEIPAYSPSPGKVSNLY